MITERAVLFRSPAEAESARPRLDRSESIPLDQFAGLVGQFTFKESDKVICQLHKQGEHCGQPHWHGWVARRKDGVEGYIGRICARNNFGADDMFSREVARINRELRVDELVARIRSKLDDPHFRDRLQDAIDKQRNLREEVANLRDRWPASLLQRLSEIENNMYSAIDIEIRFVEKDERGQDRYSWVPTTLGVVEGIGSLDLAAIRDIGNRLRNVREAADEAVPSNEQTERALRGWAESLEKIDLCESEVDYSRSELSKFLKPENLKLLCWTVRNHSDQEEIVRIVSSLVAGRAPSAAEVANAKRNWAEEIRRQNDGRDFRVT